MVLSVQLCLVCSGLVFMVGSSGLNQGNIHTSDSKFPRHRAGLVAGEQFDTRGVGLNGGTPTTWAL